MSTFLFNSTVFGPVISRRLGVSLGINLLPNDSKLCTFDCIYCECGWNPDSRKVKAVLPNRITVRKALEQKLVEMAANQELPDVITFAGNGEPTMHPEFSAIVDDTLQLRDQLAPKARIAVLSNSTMLFKNEVVAALKKIDDNILKLDSAFPSTIETMNCPVVRFDLDKVVEQLRLFNGNLVVQTMFLKGTFKGVAFDNTTDDEVTAWIDLLKVIEPKRVMIYTIARDTPIETLTRITSEKLNNIAIRVSCETNCKVEVSA